jgi:septal ring-binding cell division protein DamX
MWISNAPIERKMLRAVLIAAGISALAACVSETNPVREAVAAAGFGPTLDPAPDFVAQSRSKKLDFIPVGTTAPDRPTPARTADQVKAAETELEAVRAANEAAASAARQGASPPPAPAAPPPLSPKRKRAP